ncbi:aminodeoxychorismate synthase component I [Steroidobacter sp.]|uniref:aminodeoxychorismate synthase component I n=1 Tax=Steroidobacter sp. TaxID=1978227 RepID=UPI001A602458|nr:aminodeoxychorismate synthase component I [Steroidobacter sp.]MBL8266750.1 aminodeoxychorismate synthase component I [Steroidobacter sp.]
MSGPETSTRVSIQRAPLLQPVSADPAALLALHSAFPDRYPALLESAAAGNAATRFDILFAYPQQRLSLLSDRKLSIRTGDGEEGFLSALDRWWQSERTESIDTHGLPFVGGWLLYLGYELAGEIEPRLRLPPPSAGPIASAIRVPAAIVHERNSGNSWLVAEAAFEPLLAQMASDLANVPPLAAPKVPLVTGGVTEDEPGTFLSSVTQALEHIAAGDIYQANLSRAWRARLTAGVTPQHLYQRLRETNPAPFSGIVQLDGISVVSSSPERLVSVRDGRVSTRPIAGTRPRGQTAAADVDLARELHAHPKERAEHVMLIDLERNDLGRICEAGTVKVDEFMTIESYAHVHHIVSNVSGQLRPSATPGEVLRAVFPGGTITGCPKVRCMEIIAELEGTARGAYTGAFGYLNRDGSMDTNILIRSLEIAGDQLTLRAGAGIVADSIPERELAETRAKARGVLRALESDTEGGGR